MEKTLTNACPSNVLIAVIYGVVELGYQVGEHVKPQGLHPAVRTHIEAVGVGQLYDPIHFGLSYHIQI